MPERGRPSTSSGNAYHDVRVAGYLIDLIRDPSIASVGVETCDSVDDIVVNRTDQPTIYEQVKETAPGGGTWTALRLVAEGVLGQFVHQHQDDPDGELIFFTGAVASTFREVAERARHTFSNHQLDSGREAALAEWERRSGHLWRFVEHVVDRLSSRVGCQGVTLQELYEVFVCVRVLDSSATITELRNRCVERLRDFTDHPNRALQTLERMARNAAIQRGIIRQHHVETALLEDGASPHRHLLAVEIDAEAYTGILLQESAASDAARLSPLESQLDSPEGTVVTPKTVTGRMLLEGGHGSGKSHIATALAVNSLGRGRPSLHVRLLKWATGLLDLLVAELSRAATHQASLGDINNLFRRQGLLVLDGLDEIATGQQLIAENEILQFADTRPHLDIVVTCRPRSVGTLSQSWPVYRVRPLSDMQVEQVLGQRRSTHSLPREIVTLARNPLMLGLLSRHLSTHPTLSSESELLDSFLEEMVERESRRNPSIDVQAGMRLAEDVAFEWLSSGKVGVGRDGLRNVAASVAASLTNTRFLQTDAAEVDRWVVESGLGVDFEGIVAPIHRVLLDHLAGRSMPRRDAIETLRVPNLREAVARYFGSQGEVSNTMLSLLNAAGRDPELLARGRQLTPRDIVWPFGPEQFAAEYLDELRRLAGGPLIDVGVVGRAIEIEIDRNITWISERDQVGPNDLATVVDTPHRPQISLAGESDWSPVLAIRSAGYRGAAIGQQVPHFVAFERAMNELQTLVRKRDLPDEGSDIVYERICLLAKRFVQIVTRAKMQQYDGFSDEDFCGLTPRTLQDGFLRLVVSTLGMKAGRIDIGAYSIHFDPVSRRVVVLAEPPSTVHDLNSGNGVQGSILSRLVSIATRLGIEDVSLHPLMLLPDSESDPIQSLPGRKDLLHEESLSLYVQRHTYGKVRSFRYLVEHNVPGLVEFLRKYSTLPWCIEVAIEGQSTPDPYDLSIHSTTKRNLGSDSVTIVSELRNSDDCLIESSSSFFAYRGVLSDAYRMIEDDVRELIYAQHSLGAIAL